MTALALVKPEAPALAYLALLGPGSRAAQSSALAGIALRLGAPDVMRCPWHTLDRTRTLAIRAWLLEAYAPATANRMLSALRGVLKECWRSGLMEDAAYHRAADLPAVKSEKLPAGREIRPEELAELFRVLGRGRNGARNRALLAVLAGAGLRRSEAAALTFGDLDLDTGELKIRGAKGGRDRVAWLGPSPLAVVRAFVMGEDIEDLERLERMVEKRGKTVEEFATPEEFSAYYRRNKVLWGPHTGHSAYADVPAGFATKRNRTGRTLAGYAEELVGAGRFADTGDAAEFIEEVLCNPHGAVVPALGYGGGVEIRAASEAAGDELRRRAVFVADLDTDSLFGVTAAGVYKLIQRGSRRAGLAPLTPHDFRRTYVTRLLEAGADLAVVRDLAGHADVSTTARYDRRGERAKKAAAALLEVPAWRRN